MLANVSVEENFVLLDKNPYLTYSDKHIITIIEIERKKSTKM